MSAGKDVKEKEDVVASGGGSGGDGGGKGKDGGDLDALMAQLVGQNGILHHQAQDLKTVFWLYVKS